MKIVSGVMLTLSFMAILSSPFNIRPVKGIWTGTVYIRADGRIDPPDAPIITYDYVTYFLNDSITSSGDGIVVERSNIIINGAGFVVQGSGASDSKGINITRINNVKIENINIKGFFYGIWVYNASTIITGNNVTDTQRGIWMVGSTDNIVYGNNMLENIECSVHLEYSWGNNISGNNIAANTYYGISLKGSSGNNISENQLTNNWCGIWLTYGSSGNIISGNKVANNFRGISLDYSPRNNITENNIANNEWGILLYGYSPGYTNRIYHNNFINNTNQAQVTVGYENVWDDGYPSGGNYWSNYMGVDEKSGPNQDEPGSDGIGDTPHIIDANNRDRYPLMYPYGTETFKLIITTATGGTTNPQPGTYIHPAGAKVNVTAFPNTGYSFSYWILDGETRTENPISVIMDANHTLEAYFIDNIPPEISEPMQNPLPDNVQPFQDVTVWVNVTDYGTGIKYVTLWYSRNNGLEWTILNMTKISEGTYQAIIQGYENCTWITYKIIAYDNAGNSATKDNNGYGYKYHIIPEYPSAPILILLMLTTLIATILLKKKKASNLPNFSLIIFH